MSYVAHSDQSSGAITCRKLEDVTTAARAAYWAVKLFGVLEGL